MLTNRFQRAQSAGRPISPWLIGMAALLLVLSIVYVWPYFLDDAYIHLRYALHLASGHGFAYNLGHPTYGSSAPLWVALLAGLSDLFGMPLNPILPKVVSVLAYAATYALVLDAVWRLARDWSNRSRILLWVAFSLALASPTLSRWLQDGMETSLCTTLTVLAARWVLLEHLEPQSTRRKHPALLSVLQGVIFAAPGLIRIDLVPVSAALLVVPLWFRPSRAITIRFVSGVLVLGLWMWALWSAFHAILPDTAVAKQGANLNPFWPIYGFWTCMVSSPLLAIIYAVVLPSTPLIMWSVVRRQQGDVRLHPFAYSLPLVGTVLLGTLANQAIHGARYFLPQSMLAGLVLVLCASRFQAVRQATSGWVGAGLIVLALASAGQPALAWFSTNYRPQPIQFTEHGRDVVSALPAGTRIFAADIGLLGWETRAWILDACGLVNGREIAKARDRTCALFRVLGEPDVAIFRSEPPFDKPVVVTNCGTFGYYWHRDPIPVMVASKLGGDLLWYSFRPIRVSHGS